MDSAASGNQRFLHFWAGSLRDKELHFFPSPWGNRQAALRDGSFDFCMQGEPRVGAAPEGARGSRVGQARCQVAGEGPPNAGRLGRAVGRRPRGAGASISFLPPTPSPRAPSSRRFSASPGHQRPGPSPGPGSPPSPAPASQPSSPTSPRGPPRPGPLPLVAAGPFHNSATRLPPPGSRFAPARCPLGACALRSAAAVAAAAPFFFKGKRRGAGGDRGGGGTRSRGDPRGRRQTPPLPE